MDMKRFLLGGLAASAFLMTGCGDKPAAAGDVATGTNSELKLIAKPEPLFLQTAAKLDVGGETFSYNQGNGTEMMAELFEKVMQLEEVQAELNKTPEAYTVLNLVKKVASDSGFASIKASGISSVKDGDYYVTKTYAPTEAGYENKLFFGIYGGAQEDLSIPGMLPKTTVLATSVRLNPAKVFSYLTELAAENPKLLQELAFGLKQAQSEAQSNAQVDLLALLKELSTEIGVIVTLDKSQTVTVEGIKMAKPAVTLIIKKPGAQLQSLLGLAEKASRGELINTKKASYSELKLKMLVPQVGTTPGALSNDDFLIISSDLEIAEKMMNGKTEAPADYAKLGASMPKKGNSFLYLSQDGSDLLAETLKTGILAEQRKQAERRAEWTEQKPDFSEMEKTSKVFDQIQAALKGKVGLAHMTSFEPEGMSSYTRSTFNISQATQVGVVAYTGVVAAMVLPALGKAKARAQQAKVTNSMKQMGISIAMYFSDGEFNEVPKDMAKSMDWELRLFQQPNLKFNPTSWNQVMGQNSPYTFFIQPGQNYNKMNDSDTPLIAVGAGKPTPDKMIVLFGDFHVASIWVPGHEHMSKKELEKAIRENSGY